MTREGAFDCGSPPPEPAPEPAISPPEKEGFREKCLRKAQEEEMRNKLEGFGSMVIRFPNMKVTDIGDFGWYVELASDGDPGDEA